MRGRPVLIVLAGLAACAQTTGLERITIPPGASFAQVTDSLEAHGVVTHRLWFKFVARVRGLEREVQAGVYEIPRGTGAWRVVSVLAEGRVTVTRFTVPEGLTLLELAELAQERLSIARESVLVAATDSAEAAAVGLSKGGLEGFLLPETYQVPVGLTGRDLVRVMARTFQRTWSPDWSARLGAIGLSQAELITLASIVEGEARHDEERPIM
ncbi:MAG: endolytic transglycosylase MltG, partial [Gemmatimonadales bacterium]